MRRLGENERWREGAADRKLWKEQKDLLDNTLPDPHPCTEGHKEEEQQLYCRISFTFHICHVGLCLKNSTYTLY